jgi:hypothetical protein
MLYDERSDRVPDHLGRGCLSLRVPASDEEEPRDRNLGERRLELLARDARLDEPDRRERSPCGRTQRGRHVLAERDEHARVDADARRSDRP